MIASGLEDLILVIANGCHGQHLIKDVKFRIGPLLSLLLLLKLLLQGALRVRVVGLGIDAVWHETL